MAVIILAIETIVIGILIAALVWVVWKLIRMVRHHVDRLSTSAQDILGNVKETTRTATETAKTAQSTVGYVSDRTVLPVIEIYSAIAGARRFVQAFFGPQHKPGDTNGRQ